MEDDRVSVAKSTRSQAPSIAASEKPSVTASQRQREEEKHEAELVEIRKKYQPIVDQNPNKYKSKFVGLNPNMIPTAAQSTSKIFPMQGLWSQKSLLVSSN